MTAETFDYVIVGAGSAGCVLADRLTESGQDSVLLLEYGGSDRSIWIQMPSALTIPLNMARFDWRYYTEPEPHLNNRRLHAPRGCGRLGLPGCAALFPPRGGLRRRRR